MTVPPVLTSPLLAGLPGVRHAFFTRQGGVSTGLYDSLNLGRGSGDDPAAVDENRRRAALALRARPGDLVLCYQVHSARVMIADAPWGEDRPHADGVVTRVRGLICGALAADCAPVLLADADGRIVAAAHAGWRGALEGVIAAVVEAMVSLGARRDRIAAAVGPCIAQASYEVGDDFLAAFEAGSPDWAGFFRPGAAPGKHQFDLAGFVLQRLADAGVESAEWLGRDTCAEEAHFYSNRRAFLRREADYGRLLSAITLEA